MLDRRNNATIGASITDFVNEIATADSVIVVGTREYVKKYKNQDPKYGTFVAAEMDLINQRLTGSKTFKDSVLPVLLEGESSTSFPVLLRGRVYARLNAQENYFATLLDIVLSPYKVQFDDPAIVDLRESLRQE